MKKLALSMVPALVVLVILPAVHSALLGGHAEAQIGAAAEPTQFARCEELQLAIDTPDTDNPPIIRFYLADFGGLFAIVHAVLLPVPTPDDPDFKPVIMSGTGQVVDLKEGMTPRRVFYMNVHYSQEHAPRLPYYHDYDGRIAQVSLDLSTFKGTFWMVGTDYNAATDETYGGFDKFNIALVGQLPDCLQESDGGEAQAMSGYQWR